MFNYSTLIRIANMIGIPEWLQLFRITYYLCVVLLRFARIAAALGDEFFKEFLHFSETFGLSGGMVFGFADVFGQVVELDGLALVSAFSPTSGASGRNVLPVVVAKTGRTADGTTYGGFRNRLAATFQEGEKAEAVFAQRCREA